MKKINIKAYKVEVVTDKGPQSIPYSVVQSIENVMCASGPMTEQKLGNVELLYKSRIAEKIKASEKEGYVLLEESEFAEVKKSFNAFKGFGKNEIELCKRIEQAETVEVEEKGKKSK